MTRFALVFSSVRTYVRTIPAWCACSGAFGPTACHVGVEAWVALLGAGLWVYGEWLSGFAWG